MKSKAAVLMMVVAMIVVSANMRLAAKVLFEDKFSTLDPAWGVSNAIMKVKDSKLMITPEKNTTQAILNQANVFPNDMEASYGMTFVKAQVPTWGSGLVFWA
jgi:hypothetical protein